MLNSNTVHINGLSNILQVMAMVMKLLVYSEMKKQGQNSELLTKLNLLNLETCP